MQENWTFTAGIFTLCMASVHPVGISQETLTVMKVISVSLFVNRHPTVNEKLFLQTLQDTEPGTG